MWLPTLLLTLYFITVVLGNCPNSTQVCFNDLTCCGSNKEAALCCPYKNGVCCSKQFHCCPEGTECHPTKGICLPKTAMGIPLLKDLYSIVPLHQQGINHRPKIEVCPSKRMMCPSKSTCCPGPYIGYDCCPMSLGVCCQDFQHCCPFNTSCDTKTKQCINHHGQTFPWYKKMRAATTNLLHIKKIQLIKSDRLPLNNPCGGSNAQCNDDETCCPRPNDEFGCCGLSNATCCADGSHCCPKDTECDVSTIVPTCINSNGYRTEALRMQKVSTHVRVHPTPKIQNKGISKEWLTATSNASATLICPGGQYSCPDYMTCCPSTKGKFGCCPFPNAVCCTDKWHCCPSGSTCDLQHDRCIRGGLFTPLFAKMQAVKVEKLPEISNRNCPDKSQCPDAYTCCQLPSKKYGCCPLADAVCCNDHIHCCPHGTVCDLAAKGCKPGNDINLLTLNAIRIKESQKPLTSPKFRGPSICPGGFFECPDNTTCCRLAEGWACCPFSKGVCCKDGNNCCPNGYMCNLEEGRCINSNITNNF